MIDPKLICIGEEVDISLNFLDLIFTKFLGVGVFELDKLVKLVH